MCQRDAGVCTRGQRGSDARHNFIRDTRLPKSVGLLATAAEHERIASFEPDDAFTLTGSFDHHFVDVRGAFRMVAGQLRDAHTLGIKRRTIEDSRRYQLVV
jgi:hypothetical protein